MPAPAACNLGMLLHAAICGFKHFVPLAQSASPPESARHSIQLHWASTGQSSRAPERFRA
eukprot:5525654-Alexandrium_andersonii.AAC.1